MKALYTKTTIIDKLSEQFSQYFSEQTKPTARHLFDLVLSVLGLDGYRSVKFNYDHYIAEQSEFSLNSYYYALNESKIDLQEWTKALIKAAVSIIPAEFSMQPIVLAIDDTLIEKTGTAFENCGTLFDHTRRSGSNYLNGHCFVSLMVQIPVEECGKKTYLPIPVGYQMWEKDHSKLEIAAKMVQNAMKVLGKERSVLLCCDSWYPKGEVKDLVNEFENLTLICNARIDTALYELPPEPTGKRGRPRIRGDRMELERIPLTEVSDTDYCVGNFSVKTDLFGRRTVTALVTKTKKSDSYRLFLCTKSPSDLNFDLTFLHNANALAFGQAKPEFLPLAIYSLRWNIEVTYYEQKTFWSLGCYMLESKTGIERLVNLLSLIYAALRLLPHQSQDFSALMGHSTQEIRFALGRMVLYQSFLVSSHPVPKTA